MKKFEYKMLYVRHDAYQSDDTTLIVDLNKEGDASWEAIHIKERASGSLSSIAFEVVLKREIFEPICYSIEGGGGAA
jgi:hypothetical protein